MPKSAPKVPKIAFSVQRCSKVPKSVQKCPECPKEFKSALKCPGCPNMSKSVQSIQKFQKWPESSQSCQTSTIQLVMQTVSMETSFLVMWILFGLTIFYVSKESISRGSFSSSPTAPELVLRVRMLCLCMLCLFRFCYYWEKCTAG